MEMTKNELKMLIKNRKVEGHFDIVEGAFPASHENEKYVQPIFLLTDKDWKSKEAIAIEIKDVDKKEYKQMLEELFKEVSKESQ